MVLKSEDPMALIRTKSAYRRVGFFATDSWVNEDRSMYLTEETVTIF